MKYLDLDRGRLLRTCAWVLGFSLVTLLFFTIGGLPDAPPVRGTFARWLYRLVAITEIPLTQFLFFFTLDATILTALFIREIDILRSQQPDQGIWPRPVFEGKRFAGLQIEEAYLRRWVDMMYIELRTDCTSKLLYFPFVVIALGAAARSPLFYPWSISTPILVVEALSVLVIIALGIWLPYVARRTRDNAISELTEHLIKLKGKSSEYAPKAAQLEMLIGQIAALRKGAFTPFTQQPLIHSLLLPVLSYGSTALLPYLARG